MIPASVGNGCRVLLKPVGALDLTPNSREQATACIRLARISHHARQIDDGVPLLGTSSAWRKLVAQHCLCQAVAHRGEKYRLASGVVSCLCHAASADLALAAGNTFGNNSREEGRATFCPALPS